ncbi:hypothetical protein LX32DRAFT_334310 [Colletotrichum zoysiae]|uniref:Uncharacterized protein n=1 Tax=Colletotrichum zoysiae TaxID=1216348 RepID=A0AAD9HJE9_9PEZI|nr:hypothetical protein LX32DRAFT_334310 [Colletotrichum zoysiae]
METGMRKWPLLRLRTASMWPTALSFSHSLCPTHASLSPALVANEGSLSVGERKKHKTWACQPARLAPIKADLAECDSASQVWRVLFWVFTLLSTEQQATDRLLTNSDCQ